MLIIGITGTIGAGKGTIVDYLVENKNFIHYSVRDFLSKEVAKRGLELNRDSLSSVANDLRKKNGPAYIVNQLYLKAKECGQNAIIESIRTPGEVYALREQADFILLAVDTSSELRFQRIKIRNSATDHIDFPTFLSNEKREMISEDPNKQNLSRCISLADINLDNSGSPEELFSEIEAKLAAYLK